MRDILQKFKTLSFVKERKILLGVSLLIVLAFVVAFGFIYVNVNRVISTTRSQVEARVSYVNDGLGAAFSNYSGLCSIVGANQTVAKFSGYTAGTNTDQKVNDAHEVMRLLSSMVSLYGNEINALAVYFPGSETVVTMARYLPTDEIGSYLDREENAPVKQCIENGSLGTAAETYIILENGNHCFVVRYALTLDGYPVYIIINFNIYAKIDALMGEESDIWVLLRDRQGNLISNTAYTGDLDFSSIFQSARQKNEFQFDRSSYYAEVLPARHAEVTGTVAAPLDAILAVRTNLTSILILTAFCLIIMIFSLSEAMNRKIFKPLELLQDAESPESVDVDLLVRRINVDLGTLKNANIRYQQERKQMLPLALGRLLNHLLDEDDISQQRTLAYSCLTMASVDDAPYYAIYAIGCTSDPSKILEPRKGMSPQTRMTLLHFLIDNVLSELLFISHPGVVAPTRKDWLLVLIPCMAETDVETVEAVNRKLKEFFKTNFDMTLEISEVLLDNGTMYFADHVRELRNNSLYMEFWGDGYETSGDRTEKNSFLYYCNTMRRMLERVNGENFDDSMELLNNILDEAFPADKNSILQARNRIQALGAIAVSTISDKYKDNPAFLDSLDLEPLQSCTSLNAFREEFRRILTCLCTGENGENAGGGNNRMAEIREFVIAHYMENELSVSSIAQQFNYSVPYLSRCFKDIYHINLLEFIQRMRINLAKELLLEHPVKSVAALSGFWDEQALVRTFKKYEGITPAEYKKLTARGTGAK